MIVVVVLGIVKVPSYAASVLLEDHIMISSHV